MSSELRRRRVRHSPAWLAVWVTVGCGLLAFAMARLGGQYDSVAAARLSSAWLLGALLLLRPAPARATGLVLLGWLGLSAGVWFAHRHAWALALALGGARALEAALAYTLLRVLGCDPAGLRRLKDLAWLGLAATLVAPLLAGALAAGAMSAWSGAPAARLWRDWWVGGVFGAITLLPLMLGATRARLHALWQPRRRLELALLGAITVLTAIAASLWLARPYVLLPLPLLWAAFRVGVLGTAALNLLTVLALLVLHQLPWEPAHARALSFGEVTFYSALSLVPPLLVSVLQQQRQATLDALRDTLDQLRLITDNVPALIGRLDRDGRYVFVNRQYRALFGQPARGILGARPEELLDGARIDGDHDPVERALAGDLVRFDTRLASGRELDVTFAPHLREGEADGFFVLAQDVTERKAAERALFEAKERAQVTLDSIGDAVVVCDTQLRITLLNPIAEDMTGWAEREALGRPFEEIVRLVDLTSDQRPLSPMAIAIRENRIVGIQLDSALERRDGLRAPIEDSAAPIHDRDGRVVGGVMVFHDVSDSRAMALKMSHQAQHDYLTDLPNRVLLQDRLTQVLATVERGCNGALLFVDLDHFKVINDSLGHQVGDLVLQEVARRLAGTVRGGDTVSRQGGDEFVVLLVNLRDPRDAARVAGSMLEALQAPVEVDGHRLHIGLSIGIALFPQDARDGRELMKQADIALYHAKQQGRRRFSYFTASMSEKAQRRLLLEHDLRRALQRQELFLVYQPKVSRPSGRLTGMEALVRWRRRDGQVVGPAEFIPIAEESGLVTQIDAWAMREACRQNKAWQDAGAPPRIVSVNVSLARLDVDALLVSVAQVLEQTGLAAGCLEIEFTESQMFADAERGSRLLEGLRALHVRTAMDDFGTGYSNLGYLAQYRFDTIKIDQSFICNLPGDTKQDAIVRAIVAMARALDAHVIAEGVETHAQADALERHGCHEIQGYLYSRPLPADALFERLLEPSA